jgi:pyruvate kinase
MEQTPIIPLQEELTDLNLLKDNLKRLYSKMKNAVEDNRAFIENLSPSQRISAENLIHYLVLRSEDISMLQDELHVAGLSSLASSESHILYQLQAIQKILGSKIPEADLSDCDYYKAKELIKGRSAELFGIKENSNIPYVMVTFDSSFADNYGLIKKLLKAGMNVARINCAHDEPDVWKSMIELIRAASEKTGIPCNIYMDIPGPKLRTIILGKGKSKGRSKIEIGQEIFLVEKEVKYDTNAVVIGCNEPGIVNKLKTGNRVFFDDGLVESIVIANSNDIARLKIVRISAKKPQIKNEKGINLPDTELDFPPLSELDNNIIPFICENADIIGYSFVRKALDIEHLQQVLSVYDRKPKIILKIETAQAVKNLPSLLLQGMKDDVFGVMIARGDLAVEIGFERLSEIQEEIIWICEAAHVPVIWATQVLDNLNKSGLATRAEITDATHASVAECIMINKGDYIIKVLTTLKDILERSCRHHSKKRYTFRQLQIASNFFKE